MNLDSMSQIMRQSIQGLSLISWVRHYARL